MRIFLSAQRIRTPLQSAVVNWVASALREANLTPVAVAEDPEAASRDPLPKIRNMVQSCQGAVVIAFERMRIVSGIEFPGGEHERQVAARSISAVWNHIEAAMAYQAGLPLLVMQEQGLYQYGVVHSGRSTIATASFSLEASPDELRRSVQEPVHLWSRNLIAKDHA